MSTETESKQALIKRYIGPDLLKGGKGNARLKDYGVHVWALIGHMPPTATSAAQVAEDYSLPVEAVEAAYAFYEQNRCAIDARLAENSDPDW